MDLLKTYLKQLKSCYGLSENEGFIKTDIERVNFFWASETVERAPLIYEAGLIIIGQGNKVGFLDDCIFHFHSPHQISPTSLTCAFYLKWQIENI